MALSQYTALASFPARVFNTASVISLRTALWRPELFEIVAAYLKHLISSHVGYSRVSEVVPAREMMYIKPNVQIWHYIQDEVFDGAAVVDNSHFWQGNTLFLAAGFVPSECFSHFRWRARLTEALEHLVSSPSKTVYCIEFDVPIELSHSLHSSS